LKRLIVLGAGGHGKVVAEAALADDWDDIEFYDDSVPEGTRIGGWPVRGPIDKLMSESVSELSVVVAIGNCTKRVELYRKIAAIGAIVPVIVHPAASVSRSASIGAGTVILAQAVVAAEALIEAGVIVNHAATVDHDCVLHEGVHICPGANVAGNVRIGTCTWVGIGAAIREGVNIGRNVIVGAGAVVTTDVEDNVVVFGVPARKQFEKKS
jgi:sugar O-acyltransferase (sialic acid O-acetyltransferase NeuD family)